MPYRVFKIAVTPTAIYIAADGNGGHLWSIGLDGSVNWIVTADGGFQAVTVVGNLIIGGGHFQNVCATPAQGAQGTCIDGQVTRNKFLAVDTNGNLQSWDPNADSPLGDFALATSPDGSQVATGGDFTNFHSGTVVQPHLALFSAGSDGGGGGGGITVEHRLPGRRRRQPDPAQPERRRTRLGAGRRRAAALRLQQRSRHRDRSGRLDRCSARRRRRPC